MKRDDERSERLTGTAQAWLPNSEVVLFDDSSHSLEGAHAWNLFGSRSTIEVDVADWLNDQEAEATILHELAHVELDHDDDLGYAEARARDEAAHTDLHRGPWEIDADALAAAMVEELRAVLTDADDSIGFLVEDAHRYP